MSDDSGAHTRHLDGRGRLNPVRLAVGPVVVLATVLAIPAGAAAGVRQSTAFVPASARTLLAWGRGLSGELGNRADLNSASPVKVFLPAGTKITAVASGFEHTLALTASGRVLAWGDNAFGELGDRTTRSSDAPVLVPIRARTKITAIAAGCRHSLALTASGRVLAWGANSFGQLGIGTRTNSDRPVAVKLPAGVTVRAISAGCYFSLALTSAGRVLAWGRNETGGLGDGGTASRWLPVRVLMPAGITVRTISAGSFHGVALTTAGVVLTWGEGSHVPVPMPISLHGHPVGRIVSLVAGSFADYVLTSRGTVVAWGTNNWGQLGNGQTGTSSPPVRVLLPPGTKVRALSGGYLNAFATTATGQVFAWGYNLGGQLGNDSSDQLSSLPVLVSLPARMVAVALNSGSTANHTVVLTRAVS